jgi:hypothetical protein
MEKEVKLAKPPFSVSDRGAFIRKAFIACELVSVPTYECLTYSIAYDRVEMMHIPVSEMGTDHNAIGLQYYVDGHHVMGGPAQLVKTHLQWLRNKALESGATPDAIRVLSKITGKFTRKEEDIMAEKLKAKSAPKKADTKALKGAAKAAPVGGPKKNPGNAAALAKAREAKAVNRKYRTLVKAKDLTLRDDTWTKFMVETILANKDTDSARAAHKASKQFPNKNLDFSWASAKDYIAFA